MRRFLMLALLLGARPLVAQTTAREIASKARPAVVRITAIAGAREIGQGTGFFVSSDGRLVTNRHVVEGADRLRVDLADGETYVRVYLVSDDSRRDLVILRVPVTGSPALALGDDRSLHVGDPLYVMGNPMGLDGTFSDGLVSAERTIDGVSWIQMSAPISPGSSGGPVFNDRGEVVGIATLIVRDAQNLNMALPVRYVSGLLAMDERPQLFDSVAGRFADSEAPTTGAEARTTDDMPEWAVNLLAQSNTVDSIAHAQGWVNFRDPVIEMLDESQSYSAALTFLEAGDYDVVGVCDEDCGDLDLGLYDGLGKKVSEDVETDAYPELTFHVTRPGKFTLKVYMAQCSAEPCAFVVQAYKKR